MAYVQNTVKERQRGGGLTRLCFYSHQKLLDAKRWSGSSTYTALQYKVELEAMWQTFERTDAMLQKVQQNVRYFVCGRARKRQKKREIN